MLTHKGLKSLNVGHYVEAYVAEALKHCPANPLDMSWCSFS